MRYTTDIFRKTKYNFQWTSFPTLVNLTVYQSTVFFLFRDTRPKRIPTILNSHDTLTACGWNISNRSCRSGMIFGKRQNTFYHPHINIQCFHHKKVSIGNRHPLLGKTEIRVPKLNHFNALSCISGNMTFNYLAVRI